MKKIIFLIIPYIFLISCSSFGDAAKVLRNEKVISNDEFLVEKRNPLVLPPNFDELPLPGSMPSEKVSEDSKIKKILKSPKIQPSKNNKSSVEQSILKSIRK